jgi:AcrR family transcriptional regulator
VARKLPQDVRLQQILDAARSCFLQEGYYQTRVDDIAKRAGLSKGGVYFHFPSKRDIFRELVENDYRSSMGALREIVASPDDLPRKLRALARHFLQLFATNADHSRFMVVLGDMALRDPEMRAMLQQLHRSYIDELSNLLRQGLDQGDLRELDVESAAELLKAVLDGIEMAFALGVPPRIDKLLRTGLEIILHGVQRDEKE